MSSKAGSGVSTIERVFVTHIYRAQLDGPVGRRRLAEIAKACQVIADEDAAGQRWAREHGYPGYTSYASLDDVPGRFPEFADLVAVLDEHVAAFAAELDLDLSGRPLALDSLWINVLEPGGFHSGHIHPHAVVSGTYYVAVPRGSSALRFEDPRLPMLMAAPPRRCDAAVQNRTFHEVAPKAGALLLWESWLRHEVPRNQASAPRVSVSFNYRWG